MRPTPAITAALLLALHLPARAGTVAVDGERWWALQPPRDEVPERPPGPTVSARTVDLAPIEGGVRVQAQWRVEALEPGWFEAALLGTDAHVRQLTWNGRPAAVIAKDGQVRVAGWVDGPLTLELVADVPGDPTRGPLAIPLLAAPRGVVRVDAPEHRVALTAPEGASVLAGDGYWSGGDRLSLQLLPPAPPAVKADIALAHTGMGLTFGDAEVRGRARVRWEVRQGTLPAVSLRVAGVGSDLDVVGPNVRSWSRSGDTVQVELHAPVLRQLELDLTWSTALPTGAEATVPLPVITPGQAWRTDGTLQLARDGEVEVVPSLDKGWEALPASELPAWGQGLVVGTPTATWKRAGASGADALQLYRFEALEQPAAVIDVAAYTVATTAEGRSLVRAHYEVRNERAAHLRVVPPAGTRIIGVRVSGELTIPATDGDGWLVPLLRSVETVEGLLSFPVEVILLGQDTGWGRRENRLLPLPRVDAPVATTRTTVYLPPGYASRLEPGESGVIDAFTEGDGIAYGLGVGEVGAAKADAAFQQAVQAWMSNDFGQAQAALDELQALGAENENVRRLQSNLDVVEGRSAGGDVAMERRIKEQARARGAESERQQQDYLREADKKKQAGDYSGSASLYQSALEIGEELAKLEQREAVEVTSRNQVASSNLSELTELISKSAPKRPEPTPSPSPSPVPHEPYDGDGLIASGDEIVVEGGGFGLRGTGPGGGGYAAFGGASAGENTYDFDDMEIDGELVEPESAQIDDDRFEHRPEPVGRYYETTVDAAPANRNAPSVRIPTISIGGRKGSSPPPPPAPMAGPVTIADAPLPEPEVTAAAMSVVVPAVGEPVLFQRLLLPAGAEYAVHLRAKESTRGRR